MKFRTLRADEIDVRVATIKDYGISLLLYKDARCDMNILDETVGPENWTRHHEVINGNLFCNVGIKVEKGNGREFGEWVFKQDVGTESYTEKEKGQASDSFKRACFNWGIGRELYTSPFIWIEPKDVEISEYKGKLTTKDKFSVAEIGYTDGKISSLKIRNDKRKKIVYSFGTENNTIKQTEEPKQKEEPSLDNLNNKIKQPKANTLQNEVKRLGMTDEQFLTRYKKSGYTDFTEQEWLKLYPALQKIK